MRNAKTSSKLSPINSTARTTFTISKPFITISCTTGGYSSTSRIGVGVSSSHLLAAAAAAAATGEAAEATDAAADATKGATEANAASGIRASLETFALDVGRDATACGRKQF